MRLIFLKKNLTLKISQPEKSNQKGIHTNEEYLTYIGNDSLIYVKSGFRQIPEFMILAGKKETKLRVRDYSIDNQFSYRNGKIVYATFRPDLRWGYRDYSDLRIIDLANGKEQTLTNRTKYFSPDISEDGKTVIAVEEASNGKCTLKLLNAATGKIIQAVPNPDRTFLYLSKILFR